MLKPVASMLRAAALREGEPLNVLTWPTHEAYQTGLSHTGHNFYLWRGAGFKEWNREFRPLPRNHTLLDPGKGADQIPPDVTIDLVLSQNRMGQPHSQFAIAESLAYDLHIPHVAIEHTLPPPDWDVGSLVVMRQMVADYNVFISEYSKGAWGWGDASGAVIVEHGIDTHVFRPPGEDVFRKPAILAVVNDWINRDIFCGFHLWRRVTAELPCFVLGDTPGLSAAAKTLDELVWAYQSHAIFINTATASPVPTALLEAMACGCAVVTTSNPMTADIIRDGENGYITNDEARMRACLVRLLESPNVCRHMGDAARRTIQERFPLPRFAADWDGVLRKAAKTLPRVRPLVLTEVDT